MRVGVSIGLVSLVLVLGTSSLAWVSRSPGERVIALGEGAVVLRPASAWKLPPVIDGPLSYDCNNPMVWDGDTLYYFTSHQHPYRSVGTSVATLNRYTRRVLFDTSDQSAVVGGRWAEAVYRAPSGRLYMWYHHEPKNLFPGHANEFLTAPRIGQMVSDDNGLNWSDQGIILEAPGSSFDTETTNLYFGGGYGDFSVIADHDETYLYALISTYHRDVASQGVALARMAVADLDDPSGRFRFWSGEGWEEPPSDGRITPLFPADESWHRPGTRAFWGPAVHWNTQLKAYVVLMNRSINPSFGQGGVYITSCARLDDPTGWTKPVLLLDTKEWYPQVVGMDAQARETDRLAGRVARLFVRGVSEWELEFRDTAP